MIGVDEVGRGAWAGPLLVCAAKLKPGAKHLPGIRDSKTLTKLQREELYVQIPKRYEIGEGWVSNDVIDQLGLSRSLQCATLLALHAISAGRREKVIIDGNVNFCKNTSYCNVDTMIKADDTIKEVSVASIYAKVLRDNYMDVLSQDYPEYGYSANVGYGTKAHRKAIETSGLTPLHRRSFNLRFLDK